MRYDVVIIVNQTEKKVLCIQQQNEALKWPIEVRTNFPFKTHIMLGPFWNTFYVDRV